MEIIKDKSGKEIAVLSNDLISGWIKEHGELAHDQNSLPQILKYIKDGDVVIDGGAFLADHTVAYANAVGISGKVYAFEPNPVALQALKFNVKDLPQVKVFDNALSYCGDKNNYIIEYVSENVGASFLKQKEKGNKFSICIDSLPLERLNLLKADIEGMEYHMLNGATETIEKFKPIIVLEINRGALERNGHTPQMIFEFLDKMNYFYRNIYVNEAMKGDQYDIIAFHKSKQ